jgi:hypothetical protein
MLLFHETFDSILPKCYVFVRYYSIFISFIYYYCNLFAHNVKFITISIYYVNLIYATKNVIKPISSPSGHFHLPLKTSFKLNS